MSREPSSQADSRNRGDGAGRAILQFDESKPSEVFSRSTPRTKVSELQNCRPGTTNRICSYCPDLLDGLKSKVVSPGIATLAGNSAITNCDSKRRCKAREAKALTALTVPPFSLDEGDVFQTTVCRGSWDYDVTAAQLPINAAASMREASTPDSTVVRAVSRFVSNHQRGRAILPVAIAILLPTMALSLPR